MHCEFMIETILFRLTTPQEMNVHVTFIERSPRAYARTSGVRRDHREREHVQDRERSRA